MKNKTCIHGKTEGNCSVRQHWDPTDKPQHTPTPWSLADGNAREIWAYKDLNDVLVATCEGVGNTSTDQQRINAAFIVRAVNCHEELINSLKELFDRMRDVCDDADIEMPRELLEKVEKTIAKAEEK